MAALALAVGLVGEGCGGGGGGTPTAPSPSPAPKSAGFSVTFGENPVPYKSSGCNASTPQGWYTSARLQETNGVSFTVSSLTQKLDGSPSSLLMESFNSRFGACSDTTFTPGTIAASGAVCATVGVCTSNVFSSYQFEIAGSDANGHMLTYDSLVLQLGARPAGQLTAVGGLWLTGSPSARPNYGEQ